MNHINLLKTLVALMENRWIEPYPDESDAIEAAKAAIAESEQTEIPKDRPVLLDVGLPWVVVGIWSEAMQEWATAELECSVFEGAQDPGWVTEWAKTGDIKAWMPLTDPGMLRNRENAALDHLDDVLCKVHDLSLDGYHRESRDLLRATVAGLRGEK